MTEIVVNFLPDNISATISPGKSVLDAAKTVGINLNASCGGTGSCNKCLVIPEGSYIAIRACKLFPDADITVTIPHHSRRNNEMQIITDGLCNIDIPVAPFVTSKLITITPPELDDLRSDADRITDALSETSEKTIYEVEPELLKILPDLLRNDIYNNSNKPNCQAIINGNKTVIGLFPTTPDVPAKKLFGVAVDLGTTTIAALLIDLTEGKIVDRASCSNPQISFGDDVISRINYTMDNIDGLKILHDMAIDAINTLCRELAGRNKFAKDDIYEITVVGNATMQHILANVPVSQIAISPYVAGFSNMVTLNARETNLTINPLGSMTIAPGIAGHLGGDTVAVAVALEMDKLSGINLAIDIGTNGEIVLANNGKLLCCSTAAGPAFEGAKIQYGTRAATGAIENFSYSNASGFKMKVIGNTKPTGICGSGLVDILAVLLDAGIIDQTGRMLKADELTDESQKVFAERITSFNDQPAFIVAETDQSGRNDAIIITQRDVRETQLGKAAIAAGVEVLLNEAGLQISDLNKIFIAGAFGNYLHPVSAGRIGLFPAVEPKKILSVGNAAGTGAMIMLINHSKKQYSQKLAGTMQYVELAGRSDFQMIFSEKMFF